MRIVDSARKHGIADEDMRHAARHFVSRVWHDEGVALVFGPDTTGRLLEVGIVDRGGEIVTIIHAMPIRPKFLRHLPKG